MKSKLIAAAVSVAGLVLPASAMAQQTSTQAATVDQTAISAATANPTVANVNVPTVTGSGENASTGDNTAVQGVSNRATSVAANVALTGQRSTQIGSQDGGDQTSRQTADVDQGAASSATANPAVANVNAPRVTGTGSEGSWKSGQGDPGSWKSSHGTSAGDNTAVQGLSNRATSVAANVAKTGQSSTQIQPADRQSWHSSKSSGSSSHGTPGSWQSGQGDPRSSSNGDPSQASTQAAGVDQSAVSTATANPINTNLNMPIVMAIGGNARTGNNTAAQGVHNSATSAAANAALTGQGNTQRQS